MCWWKNARDAHWLRAQALAAQRRHGQHSNTLDAIVW